MIFRVPIKAKVPIEFLNFSRKASDPNKERNQKC